MGRRRGFFAELQHQSAVAARQREQAARAAYRQQAAAAREAERAAAQAERARASAARASEADQKRAQAEAKRLHIEAREAEVNQLNANLAAIYDELDNLLAATLDIDDFVDLESLRVSAQHPPFSRPDLEQPTPAPPPVTVPAEPTFVAPPAPSGLGGLLGKKKHAEAVEAATRSHAEAVAQWQRQVAEIPTYQARNEQLFREAEQRRLAALAQARAEYDAECAVREKEAEARNAELDTLISGLAYGASEAVEEYIGIVISNTVYPQELALDHEFRFEPSTAELRLRVLLPPPQSFPTVKAYRYTKATDEITSSELPQKEQKDRYERVVHQVALRSVHEVLEADRRGVIRSVSLEVGTNTLDAGTGHPVYVPFVALAVDRERFLHIDLRNAVPPAALAHLGASVSKNPAALSPIDPRGVRSGS